jgi:cardiolipin synthase A/B
VTHWLETIYSWFYSEIFTRIGFLLALILMAGLLRQRRSPSSTIAWLLAILLLPNVGVPLYIIFGGRKVRRLARRKERIYQTSTAAGSGNCDGAADRLLASYGVPPPSGGNCIELVPSGVTAYERVVELIQSARSSIQITTYILGSDQGSKDLVGCLTRKAAEGVAVRVLIDSLGSWRLRRGFLAPLVAAGGEVASFMPVLNIFRGRANLRNHRKLLVVDSRSALTGGMNLAWPYIGPPGSTGLWRDLSVVVRGPAVLELNSLFASDWKFATGKDSNGGPPPDPGPCAAGFESTAVQVVASGPDVEGDPLYEALLALIFAAQTRIWIVTPYYVPDEMLARALGLAARRGVDVRVILPAHSNHITADLARASYLRDLHTAGGRILFYEPVMLHAKAVLFDDRLAVIGSANMDMRSLFLNFEVALFVHSPEQVNHVAAWAEALMADSKPELPTPGWAFELAENVVRLLSPLL